MKKTNAHRNLHLVTAEEKEMRAQQQPSTSSQQELDRVIASGVRRYQELQQAFDRELFGDQDMEKIGEILPELQLLRQRLASYGIHVRL
jgi:hypothetical protein